MTEKHSVLPPEVRKDFLENMFDCGLTFSKAANEMKCQAQNLAYIIKDGKKCSLMMHFKIRKFLGMMKTREKVF